MYDIVPSFTSLCKYLKLLNNMAEEGWSK